MHQNSLNMLRSLFKLAILFTIITACKENTLSDTKEIESPVQSKTLVEMLRNAKPSDFTTIYINPREPIPASLSQVQKKFTGPTASAIACNSGLDSRITYYRDDASPTNLASLATFINSTLFHRYVTVQNPSTEVVVGIGLRTMMDNLSGVYITSKIINMDCSMSTYVRKYNQIRNDGDALTYPAQVEMAFEHSLDNYVVVGYGARNVDALVTTLSLYYAPYDAATGKLVITKAADIVRTVTSIADVGSEPGWILESSICTWHIAGMSDTRLLRTFVTGIAGRSKNGNFTRAGIQTASLLVLE